MDYPPEFSGLQLAKHLLTGLVRGGTNLRVGFVELLAESGSEIAVNGYAAKPREEPRLRRLLEQSWPIGEHLKNENADSLFSFIGKSVATVVDKACHEWGLDRNHEVPMGVTFSFPMVQKSLSQATLMSMGKGFAITSKLDLGTHLLAGYEVHRQDLPCIKITAIANDAVATLVSFIYQFRAKAGQKAAMGIICGTGSNATIPLRLSSLHPNKRPETVSVIPGQDNADVRIAVNTEWSINGSAPPLRKHGLISRWDTKLDLAGEAPGFQPLEYMSSGRYLGELGRLIFIDYLTSIQGFRTADLPAKLRRKFGLSTTFLGHYKPQSPGTLLEQLEQEFPLWANIENMQGEPRWTQEIAEALYRIAVAIEVRAAGLVAASIIGLLTCAEEFPDPATNVNHGSDVERERLELVVGYTGGCITGFQEYLKDCQGFLDRVVAMDHGEKANVRVLLSPCHDGGITGAGILVPASLKSGHERT